MEANNKVVEVETFTSDDVTELQSEHMNISSSYKVDNALPSVDLNSSINKPKKPVGPSEATTPKYKRAKIKIYRSPFGMSARPKHITNYETDCSLPEMSSAQPKHVEEEKYCVPAVYSMMSARPEFIVEEVDESYCQLQKTPAQPRHVEERMQYVKTAPLNAAQRDREHIHYSPIATFERKQFSGDEQRPRRGERKERVGPLPEWNDDIESDYGEPFEEIMPRPAPPQRRATRPEYISSDEPTTISARSAHVGGPAGFNVEQEKEERVVKTTFQPTHSSPTSVVEVPLSRSDPMFARRELATTAHEIHSYDEGPDRSGPTVTLLDKSVQDEEENVNGTGDVQICVNADRHNGWRRRFRYWFGRFLGLFDIPLILFFGIFLYVMDVGSDILAAVNHFQEGHLLWGSLTITFVILPAVCWAVVSRTWWYYGVREKEHKEYTDYRKKRMILSSLLLDPLTR